MRLSKLHLVPVFLMLGTAHVATAREVVQFKLNESELSTPEARGELLDRMTDLAMKSCESGSVLVSREAVQWCAEDLTKQFVKEINHDDLSRLAKLRSRGVYRSASR